MRRALLGVIGLIVIGAATCAPPPPPPPPPMASQTFEFTGGNQTFVVPAGVTAIIIAAFGAEGGVGEVRVDGGAFVPGEAGGLGGSALAAIPVTPGETLQVRVGGRGGAGSFGGFNGGGESTGLNIGGSPVTMFNSGGGGGGASDVRRGAFLPTDRLIVAGGGGGGGSKYAWDGPGAADGSISPGGSGGAGGGPTGGTGSGFFFATGGTQSAGGTGASPGAFGQGGDDSFSILCAPGDVAPCAIRMGGGGGGGYFGGGGGPGPDVGSPPVQLAPGGGGGGGGSGFGPDGTGFQTGVRNGNGQVVIAWFVP